MDTNAAHGVARARRSPAVRPPILAILSAAALLLPACSFGSPVQSDVESMASAPSTQAPTTPSTEKQPSLDAVATTSTSLIDGRNDEADPAEADLDTPPMPEVGTGELPEADRPEEAIAKVQTALAAVDADLDGELLDVVEPLDAGPQPSEVIDVRDGARINEAGERNQLDEAAGLACANVEIALTALDEGESSDAAEHLDAAARRAEDSALIAVADWVNALDEQAAATETGSTPDAATLFAFLTTCTQGGYEL